MNTNTNTNSYNYWPASYSYLAIGVAFLTAFLIVVYIGTDIISPIWILANILILFIYFVVINRASVRSVASSDSSFTWRLFWMAWISRLVAASILVIIAEMLTDRSFYVGAIDAVRYNRVGIELSQLISAGQFERIFPHLTGEYLEYTDNYGVPLVLGFVYTLFGQSVIVGKLFFTLMGTGTVLLVYKTTRLIWDESTARLAGIMLAFFPLALFYSSVILKEEFVVFLSMAAIYIMTKSAVENRIELWDLVLLISTVTFIFLFRTAAGALLVSLVAGTYLLNQMKGSFTLSILVGLIILTGFFYFIDVFGEVDYYVERIKGAVDFSEARIQSVAQENRLARIAGIPVFVVLSFFAPFPSMVYLPLGGLPHDDTYYWISGLMIWNFLIFFGLLGLWKAFWTKRRESLALWGFAAGYTVILGVTALFTAVRFGYNVMPMFFILIAVGVHYRKDFPYWRWYLLMAMGLIFAWNFFRLAGRGML